MAASAPPTATVTGFTLRLSLNAPVSSWSFTQPRYLRCPDENMATGGSAHASRGCSPNAPKNAPYSCGSSWASIETAGHSSPG